MCAPGIKQPVHTHQQTATSLPGLGPLAPQALRQLEAALEAAGSSRDHLVSVTVLLKDSEVGRAPFAAAWNRFVSAHALPALTVHESFLGREELLVSVTGMAAVPSQQ